MKHLSDDWAVLHLAEAPPAPAAPLPGARAWRPVPGEQLMVLSYDREAQTRRRGMSGCKVLEEDIAHDSPVLTVGCLAEEGWSGGPILSNSGGQYEVVALTVGIPSTGHPPMSIAVLLESMADLP
jgi:hypothetical protein